jgi:hypothetical protein
MNIFLNINHPNFFVCRGRRGRMSRSIRKTDQPDSKVQFIVIDPFILSNPPIETFSPLLVLLFKYGYPKYGYPEYGYPEYGYPEYGYPEYGYPEHGYAILLILQTFQQPIFNTEYMLS